MQLFRSQPGPGGRGTAAESQRDQGGNQGRHHPALLSGGGQPTGHLHLPGQLCPPLPRGTSPEVRHITVKTPDEKTFLFLKFKSYGRSVTLFN